MQDWLLRPYPHEILRTNEFLQSRIIAVGWPAVGDVSGLDEEGLQGAIDKQYSNWDDKRRANGVACLHSFVHRMEAGDLVLVAPKTNDFGGMLMLAEVTGDYGFHKEFTSSREGYPHQREVSWVRPRIARSKLPDTLAPALKQRGVTLQELEGEPLREWAAAEGWKLGV